MKIVVLKPGRESSLLRRHPWVFSGAIAKSDKLIGIGETVDVMASDGRWLARGAYSPESQIRIRVWSFEPKEEVDSALFRDRLSRAIRIRSQMGLLKPSLACRLVNAESDGLPGMIVDRYGDLTVCQFLSAGADAWKQEVVRLLQELLPAKGVFERSDSDVRAKEGMEPGSRVLAGSEPPDLVEIVEDDVKFLVDIRKGHKTGFYLDQRTNRAAVSEFAPGRECLNCFSYTGGFGVRALKAGAAAVVNVDTSKDALALGRRILELNGLPGDKTEDVAADAFQELRRFRDAGRRFDLIVLDPPKFASSSAQVEGACRGYKDINMLAFSLLRPEGILFTFSCSGRIMPPLFQKIVADAALDARRPARIIRFLGQAPDHPVLLSFPEAHYLKGLICRVE